VRQPREKLVFRIGRVTPLTSRRICPQVRLRTHPRDFRHAHRPVGIAEGRCIGGIAAKSNVKQTIPDVGARVADDNLFVQNLALGIPTVGDGHDSHGFARRQFKDGLAACGETLRRRLGHCQVRRGQRLARQADIKSHFRAMSHDQLAARELVFPQLGMEAVCYIQIERE